MKMIDLARLFASYGMTTPQLLAFVESIGRDMDATIPEAKEVLENSERDIIELLALQYCEFHSKRKSI